MRTVTNETPISFLTVGELRGILEAMHSTATQLQSQVQNTGSNLEEYAYGMSGLRELFKCSHTTAWKLKKSILKPAIMQCGRKFQIRKETALQLFADSQKK